MNLRGDNVGAWKWLGEGVKGGKLCNYILIFNCKKKNKITLRFHPISVRMPICKKQTTGACMGMGKEKLHFSGSTTWHNLYGIQCGGFSNTGNRSAT